MSNLNAPPSPDILNLVIPRLWKKTPFSRPILTLEIIGGPYKGVIFCFTRFDMQSTAQPLPNGMVPVRFETEIFKAPDGFTKDEQFDAFSSEIVIAWLHYVNTNSLSPMLAPSPDDIIH